jgi:hypothetical protein
MEIKIGDKVRFLNSVGGGIVRSFQGKDRVWVEGGDGFEIPSLVSDLVVAEHLDSQAHTPKPKAPPKVATHKPAPEPERYKPEKTAGGERLNICLAYLPVEPKAMQQSGYEAYFINDSNYYVFFNYMNRQDNSWTSRFHGLVEPNTKVFMEEFGKEALNELERICVQLIAWKKDKPYSLKNAVSVELRVDTVKFYKTHCFVENDFFDEDALLFPVVRDDLPEKELLVSAAELQEAMQQKAGKDRPKPKPARPKETDDAIVEVDLHLRQLLDNTTGLSNKDMLNYQLMKFRETLARYAKKKGQQIIFIHGKGDGILRSAIEKELKTKYKQYDYQFAPFLEYGFGATMVTIH